MDEAQRSRLLRLKNMLGSRTPRWYLPGNNTPLPEDVRAAFVERQRLADELDDKEREIIRLIDQHLEVG